MYAAIWYAPGDIRWEQRPDPRVELPTDAVVRIVAACVCGSDLWTWRGARPPADPHPIGHEFVGVVEEIGAGVTTLSPGDFVIGPFSISDGTCVNCRHGITTSCLHGQWWGRADPDGRMIDGAQGQYVRVPFADDGAAAVRDLLADQGADTVLECVGTQVSMAQALASVRPGGRIGFVGVPLGGAELPIQKLFSDNITVGGGVAPVRPYLRELLPDVLEGRLDPGPVFDLELPMAQVADAYRAMDERRSIKTLLWP